MTTTAPIGYQQGTTETVGAALLNVGDVVVLPDRIDIVTQLVPYNLAYGDRLVATSNPPTHRWSVLHILTSNGGIARFPHEPVTRLVAA